MRTTSGNPLFDKVILAVEQTVYVDGQTLTPASRLVDDLRLGKFGRIRLALYLEETFDIELPDEDINRFITVGDIVHYMRRWSFEMGDDADASPAVTRH